ncbi:cyclin-dependent kinase 2-associated protein 1-like, partial [Sinocyclocheilus anshuiensis]|uniref:cyclin-dependent kinase 2-associated protein 1-like n=1 Tax=Sinocyclocheilus anshuiensis TaxID=1608454 RepID=UPI0007B9DFA2
GVTRPYLPVLRCKQKVSETDAPLILGTILFLSFIISSGMSYKPNLHQHLPGTSGNQGNIPSPSSMATIQSYKPFLNDFGPPSLGFPQVGFMLLYFAIIEELGKEIRPTYAGSKSAMERLKRGIIHARGLVRECLAETERNARS